MREAAIRRSRETAALIAVRIVASPFGHFL
jgi:hypothetical protein